MSDQQISTRDLMAAFNNAEDELNHVWSIPTVQLKMRAAIDALDDLTTEKLIVKAQQDNDALQDKIKRNEAFIEGLKKGQVK